MRWITDVEALTAQAEPCRVKGNGCITLKAAVMLLGIQSLFCLSF